MFLTADNGSYRGIHALMEVAASFADFSSTHNFTAQERLVLQGLDCPTPKLTTGPEQTPRTLHGHMKALSQKLGTPSHWPLMSHLDRAIDRLRSPAAKHSRKRLPH